MRKLLKIFGIIFLSCFFIIVILLVILFVRAKSWKSSFESNIEEGYLVSSVSESNDFLNEKIEGYIISNESVDFIEFSPLEISQSLYNMIFQMITDTGIDLLNIYSEPGEDLWKECILLRLNDSENLKFWVCMDVTKDNMQTAQLYVNNITVNGLDIDRLYPAILTKVNQGMAEALVTANENAFVGRMLDNIELKQDRLIIKGSQY